VIVIDMILLGSDDWRLWRELRLAALAEAPAAFGSTLSDWSGSGDTEERWRARLACVALNIVLTWNGEPAGMVSATTPGGAGAIELISMWVAPFARGHGVGDAAVRRVLAWAQIEHGGSPVVLSVKANNDPAIRLYRRHGFTDVGPSPNDPDERLMRLS
jgi:ribosomal protein S18 acetylase RimI-like enzyme